MDVRWSSVPLLRQRVVSSRIIFVCALQMGFLLWVGVTSVTLFRLSPFDMRWVVWSLIFPLCFYSAFFASRFLQWSVAFFLSLLLGALKWIQTYEAKFGNISAEALFGIFQTDFREGWQYFYQYADVDLFCVVFLIYIILFFPRSVVHRTMGAHNGIVKAAVVFLLTANWGLSKAMDPVVQRGEILSEATQRFNAEIGAQENLRQAFKDLGFPEVISTFKGNVVLVLGESTARKHMQLYGYYRETNPRLVARKDSLLIHRDSVAPHGFGSARGTDQF